MKVTLWHVGALVLLGVLGWALAPAALAPMALAQSPETGVRGVVTEVSRSAEIVVVEENPSEESGSAKGEFAVTDETEILEQRDEELAPVDFEVLRVGQMVEATYSGPVAESYPTRGVAGRIVILEGGRTDDPYDGGLSVLPDTGGAPLAGVLLIGGALLALRLARFLR
ncbi:MAG TPA: DUF3221 domain-containing protein [Rubrobacteraceae bacterium]|nr:DUF3221 domain-containing protein [Rubrobacteraceae bacterium]